MVITHDISMMNNNNIINKNNVSLQKKQKNFLPDTELIYLRMMQQGCQYQKN